MTWKSNDFSKERFSFKCKFLCGIFIAALVFLWAAPSMANWAEIKLWDKPIQFQGLVTQNIAWGLGDECDLDTKSGIQAMLYNVLLESYYRPTHNTRATLFLMLSGDLAYEVLSQDSEWQNKGFDQDRGALAHDTSFRDVIQECHFQWEPGTNWYFRVGKQILVWGETIGERIMDQINPSDSRRGISDVEFETSILPIWLLRMGYYIQPPESMLWLNNFGIEFVFNPNAQFEPNRGQAGIWRIVDVDIGPIPPLGFPGGKLGRQGSLNLKKPAAWDSEGFEYALRFIGSAFGDLNWTINFFRGIDNSPVTMDAGPPSFSQAYDGTWLLHPNEMGKYPKFRYIGFTLAKPFDNLNINALGGVGLSTTFEAFYAFDSTFADDTNHRWVEHDEVRWALNLSQAYKLPWSKYMTDVGVTYVWKKIMDYPDTYKLSAAENAKSANILMSTAYWHEKIKPSIFFLRDISNRGYMFKPTVTYIYTREWNYVLGMLKFGGSKNNAFADIFKNKNHLFFTVTYQFG